MTDEILAFTEGRAGRLRLNRPKPIHALNEAMCRAMIDALTRWRADPAIEIVLIDHAVGRGFCAGGDVRAAAESARADGAAARAFFATEYRLNHLLFTYAKPIVAFLDGIVMGGGVGIALPARYRVATERTLFAMPEATIGLFPDVGGGWYLSRLPGRIGSYLALTAARLNGADCRALGLATHYLGTARLEQAKTRLIDRPVSEIAAILDGLAEPPGAGTIEHVRAEIDRLFASDRLEEITAAIEADPGPFAADLRAGLRAKSPQACKVALRLLRESALRLDFADEMRAEYGIAVHVCQRHDFGEGVRALLIDKDNAPQWDPPTAEAVTDTMLDTIFAPLPDGEAWTPLRL